MDLTYLFVLEEFVVQFLQESFEIQMQLQVLYLLVCKLLLVQLLDDLMQ